jgi:hypothetical protein
VAITTPVVECRRDDGGVGANSFYWSAKDAVRRRQAAMKEQRTRWWRSALILLQFGLVLSIMVVHSAVASALQTGQQSRACNDACSQATLLDAEVATLSPIDRGLGVAAEIDPWSLAPDSQGRPDPPLSAEELATRLAERRLQASTMPGLLHCNSTDQCVRYHGAMVEVVEVANR